LIQTVPAFKARETLMSLGGIEPERFGER